MTTGATRVPTDHALPRNAGAQAASSSRGGESPELYPGCLAKPSWDQDSRPERRQPRKQTHSAAETGQSCTVTLRLTHGLGLLSGGPVSVLTPLGASDPS